LRYTNLPPKLGQVLTPSFDFKEDISLDYLPYACKAISGLTLRRILLNFLLQLIFKIPNAIMYWDEICVSNRHSDIAK